MESQVNTINDFMKVLGEALSEGDGNTIMRLQDITTGWIQSSEDFHAQDILLNGALDAIGW